MMELPVQPQLLPQLQLFSRVAQELPLVELALSKSISTYARLKSSHRLVRQALAAAELSLGEASRQAAPYARRFESPISYVDEKLCLGLDIVEQRLPVIRKKPESIIEDAYTAAVGRVVPAIKPISEAADYLLEHASVLKDVSWSKMNEVLNSHYGALAVDSLNSTATVIEMLIDKYFPPIDKENYSELVPMEEDKLMHTLQTLGRLPVKAARRLCGRVAQQLASLGPEGFRGYMGHLLEFLRLASHLGESGPAGGPDADEEDGPAGNKSRVAFAADCKPEAE